MPSPLARRVGIGAAATAAALIALLTLAPQPSAPAMPGWQWCLACGRYGGADLVQNVLLFAPLGAGLALAGRRPWAAALVALALSGAVEALQWVGVAGRFASAGDLLANTAGGWLGAAAVAARGAWLRPRPHHARRLAAGALALWTAAVALGAWAFQHDPQPAPPLPLPPGAPPTATGMGWFAGRVHAGWVDGRRLAGPPAGPLVVGARVGRDVEAGVVAAGSDPRPAIVPILYLHARRTDPPELMLGQQGTDAVLTVRLRAARLRLRQPRLRVPHAFPASRETTSAVPVELRGSYRAGTLRLSVRRGGLLRTRSATLTPAAGWALLLPFARVGGPEAALATAAWVGALVLPIGFWGAAAGRRRALPPLATAAAATALAGALVPAALGAPAIDGIGWCAVAAALAAGGLLARRAGASGER